MSSKTFSEFLNKIATQKELHTASLYIFSKMDRASLETFEKTWPTISTQRRRDIMQELVEISEANFEVYFDPVFLLGLGDEDAQVRAAAINGLWEHENPALIEPLVHMLRTDPEAVVRVAAATALGRFVYLGELEEINPNQALLAQEALLQTIHQGAEELEVRRRAIEAVAFSGDPVITQIIENAYYDDNEKMQVSAIFAMGRNADISWRPQVIAELDNPSSEIRFEAARACGELEAGDAVPKLIELIEEDPDLEVQEMAIWALGRIGGDLAREALEICLDGNVEALVTAAEEAMDELNLFSGDSFVLYDFDYDGDVIEDLYDELPDDDIDFQSGHNGH